MKQVKILSFAEVINTLDSGGVVEEVQDHLRNVSREVVATQKAGTVTLTLKVEPAGKPGSGQIKIVETVASKRPRNSAETLFYTTESGSFPGRIRYRAS